jgi:lipid-binding SYLF domain-containing protein
MLGPSAIGVLGQGVGLQFGLEVCDIIGVVHFKRGGGNFVVGYVKSQGLFFGVSVDGRRFFTRNDIHSRAYKF